MEQHTGKKPCIAAQAAEKKAEATKRSRETASQFFRSRPAPKFAPSAITALPPLAPLNQPFVTSPSPEPDACPASPPLNINTTSERTPLTLKSGCPEALELIRRLERAARDVPSSVPVAAEGDEFGIWGGKPELYYPPGCEDVWETVDGVLNRVVGYGRSVDDIASIIRRGPDGIDGLLTTLEYLVRVHSIKGALLEGKINRILEAITTM